MKDTDFQVKQFKEFHDLLMSTAPEGYSPWFFPVEAQGKNPDALAIMKLAPEKSLCCNSEWVKRITRDEEKKLQKAEEEGRELKSIKPKWRCDNCEQTKGSWHAPHSRITKEQCLSRLKSGGNVGLSAREGDALVLGDIDDVSKLNQVPENTLSVTSRKRDGLHFFGWEE